MFLLEKSFSFFHKTNISSNMQQTVSNFITEANRNRKTTSKS